MRAKKIVLCLCLIGIGQIEIEAQEDEKSINTELKELTSPTSPAFTLLGLSPTDVNRPTLAKPFALNLANVLDGEGGLASDISIETSPYWWFSRSDLTFNRYYGLEKSDGTREITNFDKKTLSAWQSLSFSLATNDASPDVDSIDSRNLAIGLKFQPIQGKISQAFIKMNNTIPSINIIQSISSDLVDLIDNNTIKKRDELKKKAEVIIKNHIQTGDSYKDGKMTQEERDTLINQTNRAFQSKLNANLSENSTQAEMDSFLNKSFTKASKEAKETLAKMDQMSRVGWILEFAGASSWFFPTNQTDNTATDKWNAWTTLTYRLDKKEGEKNTNEFNFMFRGSGDHQVSDSYNLDIGASWVLSNNNFSLTAEYIRRDFRTKVMLTATDGRQFEITESDVTDRYAIAFQYKLNDHINLTATVGKNYDNAVMTGGNIFTLLNAGFLLPVKQQIQTN